METKQELSAQAVCRLCKKLKQRRNSHLLPAALYKLMRDPDDSNPNPVLVTKAAALQTSWQVTVQLLCSECEAQFNKNGERWVLRHCYRGKGRFLLRKILENATPIWPKKEILVFPGKSIPQIEVGQLVYFATSVFWRASVYPWKVRNETIHIELGTRYEEEFRQYLIGAADFPGNAVMWVSVSPSSEPLGAFALPYGGREGVLHHYRLVIPGVLFDLFLGNKVAPFMRRLCTFRSPEGFIYLTDQVDLRVLKDIARTTGSSQLLAKGRAT